MDRPSAPGQSPHSPPKDGAKSDRGSGAQPGKPPASAASAPGARGQNPNANSAASHGAEDRAHGDPAAARNTGPRVSGSDSGRGLALPTLSGGRFPWLWLIVILLALIAVALPRKLRGGWSFRMNKPSFDMSGMWNRKKKDPVAHPTAAPGVIDNRQSVSAPPAAFLFCPPAIARKSARDWLESVLDTPRLLEPFIRRQARAVLDADPRGCLEKTLELLAGPSPKVRLAAAELVAAHAPRRSEQTLTALIEDEKTAADIRNEAVEILAETTGDRYEELFTRMLLEDSSAPAARALARLPRLEESTKQALRDRLEAERAPFKDTNAELRSNLMLAQVACVLAAHGVIEPDAAAPYIERLPGNHREQVITMVLRGSHSEWAVANLVDILLTGRAYPALQGLMECDPMQVRAILEPRSDGLDAAARTRCLIAKWVVWGEGDEEGIRRLAEAGNDLAAGAMNLARTQHWDPAGASGESLLAASFIYSLRIGFSDYPQEKVAAIFRSASDDTAYAALAESPELKPLAQVYARPEVYEAVQAAMHTEDGLNCLMAALARQPENRAYQDECAFWSDKTLAPTRLHLLHALSAGNAETNHGPVAARAKDPCSQIGAMVLRFLRTHSAAGSKHAAVGPAPDLSAPSEESPAPPESVDRAA